MAQFHSPLCEITWTAVIDEDQRSVFHIRRPLELRFGLQFAPEFWSSFVQGNATWCYMYFQVFKRGELHAMNIHQGDPSGLPGAPNNELWVGMKFGDADQATSHGGEGLFSFRPAVEFKNWGPGLGGGYIRGEFAVAPAEHWFYVEYGQDGPSGEPPKGEFAGGVVLHHFP